MRVSVSLPDSDVAFLDAYVEEEGCPSRSAAVQRAVSLLRRSHLERDYRSAWEEWASSEDGALWEATSNDGVG